MAKKMKSSGVEWIGDIPEKWEIRRFKNILRSVKGSIRVGPFGSAIKNEDIQDDGYCIYNQKSVLENNFTSFDSHINHKKFDELKSFCVLPEDMLITTRGTIGKIAFVSDNPKAGIIHPCLIKSSLDFQKINQMFLIYLFNETSITNEQFILASNATTIPVIYSDYLKNIKIPYPSLSEQKAIADYLDDRCGKIDDFIAKQKAVIEKLKEYKQSVITEAVTKGLNPAAPLKSSGVEWIGDIPEKWEIKSLKKQFSFGKGLPITKEDLVENGIPVISYGQIHSKNNNGVSVSKDLIRFVDKKYIFSNPQSLLKKGDFVFADTSEDLDGCGNAAYIDKDMTIFAGYHSIILRKKEDCYEKYFAYLFLTNSWRNQIRSIVSGIKVFSITRGLLKKISIIYPPLAEQKAIADYLDAKCAEIDAFIAKKQTVIDKLTEYKKSLIYECVTGKREIV